MVLAPLIIDLGVLLMFLGAFVLCLLSIQIVKALFQYADSKVGWIPWLGSKITGNLHVIEQRFTGALGHVASGSQARVGTWFHTSAGLVRTFGHKMADAFEMILALSALYATLASWKSVLALYHSLVGQEKATVSTVKEHTKVIHQTTVGVKHVDAKANTAVKRAQAIPADVVVPGDIAGLRGQVRTVEDSLQRLWERVRGIALPSVKTLGIAAVAIALGRLGMSWARCANVGKVGRRICGMHPSLLDALLLDTLALVGTVSLVEFIRDAQAVENVAVDALHGFLRDV